MRLSTMISDAVKRYLLYDKKLRDGKKKYWYSQVAVWVPPILGTNVIPKPQKLLGFLEYMLDKGYSAYMNVLITMAKHLDKHYGIGWTARLSRYPAEDIPRPI